MRCAMSCTPSGAREGPKAGQGPLVAAVPFGRNWGKCCSRQNDHVEAIMQCSSNFPLYK